MPPPRQLGGYLDAYGNYVGRPGAPALPPYGYPGVRQRSRGRTVGVAISVVLAVILVLCGAAVAIGTYLTKQGETQHTLPGVATRPPMPAHRGHIEDYVLPRPAEVPATAGLTAEEPLSSQLVAQTFARPADAAAIREDCRLTDGYVRRWVDQAGTLVTVYALRFPTADLGGQYFARYVKANRTGGWGTPGRVGDATTFTMAGHTSGGYTATLATAEAGDIVALVTAERHQPDGDEKPSTILAQELDLLNR